LATLTFSIAYLISRAAFRAAIAVHAAHLEAPCFLLTPRLLPRHAA